MAHLNINALLIDLRLCLTVFQRTRQLRVTEGLSAQHTDLTALPRNTSGTKSLLLTTSIKQ